MSNYIIKYSVYNIFGVEIKSGKMRVKNKFSELSAKCSLDDYLRKKVSGFHKLVVHSCIDDNMSDFFNLWEKITK